MVRPLGLLDESTDRAKRIEGPVVVLGLAKLRHLLEGRQTSYHSQVGSQWRDVTNKQPWGWQVQVQSTWFPIVDRNPQTFVDIYQASEKDFQKATVRVHHGSSVTFRTLK
jgi:hypothetical protein